MLLSEFRQQYPMYGDLSDAELADGLHRKFYSDIPRFEFDQKLGLAVNAEPSWAGDPNAIATPPDMTPRFPGGGDLPSVGFEMQQPEPMPQPALMAPTPSGLGALSVEPAATGAVPVMPSLTQALDLDEDRWGIGGAGSLDYALGGSVPAALDPVPMPADPYSGTPDWQAYPGLVVRGAAETGLGMGMALEALPQQQTDETRAFYDEYLTIQPGDRDTAEDLIRRVQRSAMTPGRKSIFTQAIAETVRSGAKMGSRDLGIDVPVDTETGTRYGRAREVLRETFPASDEQEQSLPGQVARGIGSTVGFLPFSVVPGGIWAAGALSGAGEAADRAYRTGASPEQQGTATTLGMVPGALDALAIDSIIRGVTRTPGAAGWLRAIALTGLRTGAIEGTTEGVQQAMQNVIARVTYDPDAAIAEARSHGDLSENAEYDAAKERQGFIEGRIREVEGKLGNAQIIDPTLLDADGRCVFGATVDLEDLDSGAKVSYQIVGDDEADIKEGKIAISSPIARALIGKFAGDVAEVQAPGGVRELELIDVRYV